MFAIPFAIICTLVTTIPVTWAQFLNQSLPFTLTVIATSGINSTYDNSTLYACQIGAAEESLCAGYANRASFTGDTFTFNTSSFSTNSSESGAAESYGYLTYNMKYTSDNVSETVSQALGLIYNPVSNVAMTMFALAEVDDEIVVAFDSNGYMNIIGTHGSGVYDWAICNTTYSDEPYIMLNWIVGGGEADNPSCIPVSVQQNFYL